MNHIPHPSNNARFGAPDGWDQEEAACDVLPGTVEIEDGLRVVNTWWQPTHEELMGLLAGGAVKLSIVGGQPPVRLSVDLTI